MGANLATPQTARVTGMISFVKKKSNTQRVRPPKKVLRAFGQTGRRSSKNRYRFRSAGTTSGATPRRSARAASSPTRRWHIDAGTAASDSPAIVARQRDGPEKIESGRRRGDRGRVSVRPRWSRRRRLRRCRRRTRSHTHVLRSSSSSSSSSRRSDRKFSRVLSTNSYNNNINNNREISLGVFFFFWIANSHRGSPSGSADACFAPYRFGGVFA